MKKNTTFTSTTEEVTFSVFGIIILLFLMPALFFFCGWITGWIIELTIGDLCVNGLNLVFKTSFNKTDLPMICATLEWVGSFFKTMNTSSKLS